MFVELNEWYNFRVVAVLILCDLMLNNPLLQELFDSLCCFSFLGRGSQDISVKVLKFIFIKLFNEYLLSTRSCVGSEDTKIKEVMVLAFKDSQI